MESLESEGWREHVTVGTSFMAYLTGVAGKFLSCVVDWINGFKIKRSYIGCSIRYIDHVSPLDILYIIWFAGWRKLYAL